MDKNLQDVHIIMNGNEFVLRAIHIENIRIESGFVKIEYNLFSVVKNTHSNNVILLPCSRETKVVID